MPRRDPVERPTATGYLLHIQQYRASFLVRSTYSSIFFIFSSESTIQSMYNTRTKYLVCNRGLEDYSYGGELMCENQQTTNTCLLEKREAYSYTTLEKFVGGCSRAFSTYFLITTVRHYGSMIQEQSRMTLVIYSYLSYTAAVVDCRRRQPIPHCPELCGSKNQTLVTGLVVGEASCVCGRFPVHC